jgi:hypothetical protein
MATIYRIVVQDKTKNKKLQTKVDELTTPKGSGKSFRILGAGEDRYMRPINSVMNKVTNGKWEQGTRLIKSGMSIADNYAHGGVGKAMGSVGVMVIVQFIIIKIMKWWETEKKKALRENNSNFLRLQTGQSRLADSHSVAKNVFNGKISYHNNY